MSNIQDAPTEELVMRREEVEALRKELARVTEERNAYRSIVDRMKFRIVAIKDEVKDALETLRL